MPPDNPKEDYDTLIELITATLAPDSWHGKGGAGGIKPFAENQCLVVTQTKEVHEVIDGLLNILRKLSQDEAVLETQYLHVSDSVVGQCGLHGKRVVAMSAAEKNSLLTAMQNDAHSRSFVGPIAKLYNGQSVMLNTSFAAHATGDHRR